MNEWIKGTLTEKRQWTESLFSIRVEAPIADFQAGQYIKVAMDIDGERIGRPYSLVNPPGSQPLEIYFNEVPEGPLTPRLSDLEPGDPLWVSSKAGGIFTLETVQPAQTLWLLATGTALGVYLSILRTEQPWKKFERVILVHGVRFCQDLNYSELLTEIANDRGSRFHFVPVVSREDNPEGLRGRITNLIENGQLESTVGETIAADTSHVMLCGNSAMITEAKVLLEGRGLARHRSHAPGQYTTEQYH